MLMYRVRLRRWSGVDAATAGVGAVTAGAGAVAELVKTGGGCGPSVYFILLSITYKISTLIINTSYILYTIN